MNESKLNPIGAIPTEIWAEQVYKERLKELRRAIVEYANAGLSIKQIWVTEYNIIIKQLNKHG